MQLFIQLINSSFACIRAGLLLFTVLLISVQVAAIAKPLTSVLIDVDGLLVEASLVENRSLLAKISPALPSIKSTYYKGQIVGHPKSTLRLSKHNNHWRGILVLSGQLHRIDMQVVDNGFTSTPLIAKLMTTDNSNQQLCASPSNTEMPVLQSTPMAMASTIVSLSTATMSSAVASSPLCVNPIDGVCLLPHIEFAYDLSYQALGPSSETPYERAVSEINEAELFFESGLGFRFSQLSLTMLNATQDELIENAKADHIEDDDLNGAATLVNTLRVLRSRGLLSFLQSPRSIFHFVTGRNFPDNANGDNVVGIAYPKQACERFGLNTGLTDAGDTSIVGLVMAHEIGHNLGADHDDIDVNGCPSNQNVMSSRIDATITEFSSCSIDAINEHLIDRFPAIVVHACIDFPIDVSIISNADNPLRPPKNKGFSFAYQISVNDGSIPVELLRVEGEIADATQGEFVGVNLNGASCAVDKTSYSCNIASPQTLIDLEVGLLIYEQSTEFVVNASVSSLTAGTNDMVSDNNSVSISYISFSDDDFSTFVLNTNTQTNNSGGSTSSGGGGSLGVVSLGFLLLAVFYRLTHIVLGHKHAARKIIYY